MNKQGKNGIGWCQYSWNPLKGMCPVNCKLPDGREYCYARKMYKRFGWNPEIRIVKEYPDMVFMPFYDYPKRIFVGSTFELFHPSVKKEWRDWIFDVIEYNDRHAFQILTKMPENIDREMPENVWLGVTVTKGNDTGWLRMYHLREAKAKIKFISFEPFLGILNTSMISSLVDFDWFIFGRLTGHGKKYDPDKRDIIPAVDYFRGYKKPVFLKDNLKEIWGDDLIQEFPE